MLPAVLIIPLPTVTEQNCRNLKFMMSMVKSRCQLIAEGFDCKPLHPEVLHMLYASSHVSGRCSPIPRLWHQTRVKAAGVLETPRKHSLLRLKWLHEVSSSGVFWWSNCCGWKSRGGRIRMNRELLMALCWHFSVRKDRKTQSRNKDEQKGLTPYVRFIKEIRVTASATWCYHVWQTKGWWRMIKYFVDISPDISTLWKPNVCGIAIRGIAAVKTLDLGLRFGLDWSKICKMCIV